MKKIKKNFFFYIIISIMFLFIFNPLRNQIQKTQTPVLPPPPANIEELLKDADFEKMLEELEDAIREVEKEEKSKKDEKTPEAPAKKEEVKPKEEVKKPEIVPKKEEIKQKVTEKKLTPEENFINPFEITTAKDVKPADQKIAEKLPKEKQESFKIFMDKFTSFVENLEKEIGSFALGIGFKEDLETLKTLPKSESYKNIINKIKAAKGTIESKKFIQRNFFLPAFNPLRKQIMDSIKELENIDKEISALSPTKPKKEKIEEEEEETIELLTKKAQKTKESKIPPKDWALKFKIKKLFTDKLSKIANDMEKVTQAPTAKAQIEAKKKKREEMEKRAEEFIKKQTFPTPRPFWDRQTPYPYAPPFVPPWATPRKTDATPSKPYTPETYQEKIAKRYWDKIKDREDAFDFTGKGKDKDSDKDKGLLIKDEKNKVKQIINLTNKNI